MDCEARLDAFRHPVKPGGPCQRRRGNELRQPSARTLGEVESSQAKQIGETQPTMPATPSRALRGDREPLPALAVMVNHLKWRALADIC